MSDGAESANSCVKCALSSLGCSRVLRSAIDALAVRVHEVAVRGTHLANHVVASSVRTASSSDPLPEMPNVFEPKWWQQCFKAAANPRSGKPGVLQEASASLFVGSPRIELGSAAIHAIETLSKDIVVNVRVMLILNFHKQLRKAFRRDVVSWAAMRDFAFEKADREALVDYCVWRCVQQGSLFREVEFPLTHRDPEELGVHLQADLDSKIDAWRSLYGQLLPCPVPEFISNFKDSRRLLELFRWFVDMQRQRRDRLAELAEYFSGNAELARKTLQRAGKAMRALPLTKLRVGHVAVDRTALKFLLLELQKAGELISDLEIPLLAPVEVERDENGEPRKKRARLNSDGTEKKTRNRRKGADDAKQTDLFWSHFPNARRLVRGRKNVRLYPFIRTDGISCSVALIIPGRPSSREEVKAAKKTQNCADRNCPTPPLLRGVGQRLVAVDPGRRDMVYCFVQTDHPRPSPSCCSSASCPFSSSQFFRVSTREHVKEAKRKRIGDVTVALQRRTILEAQEYRELDRHVDLHSALKQLPSNKAFETYDAYEAAMLPILDEAVAAMRARRLRREAFLSYQSKDKALDRICSKICGGVAVPLEERETRPRVLVAFGNGGTVSSTGCGYAPAPQARLRRRLQHVWGARVSLINEYHTSKCCWRCGSVMLKISKRRNKGVVLTRAKNIHGVLRCGEHGFVHRDKNAAINIARIYEALAAGESRPDALRPPNGSRFT